MLYCTMICDLKSSRQLNNRDKIQYAIIDMLKEANEKFADRIKSPFLITIGDEWQGLLKYPCDYMELIHFFKKKCNLPFYVAIGIGEVTIHNFELTVNQLDGPSFYRARDAMNFAKQNNLPLVILYDRWESAQGFDHNPPNYTYNKT